MEIQESEAPRHNIINSHFDSKRSSISVMCYGARFDISVSAEDLGGGCFAEQYSKLVGRVHGGDDELIDDYEELCDWILEPCFSQFKECYQFKEWAPPQCKETAFSLQDYYYPKVYYLKLVVSKGRLQCKRMRRPKSAFANGLAVPINSLPPFRHIPHFKATDVQIVPDAKNGDHVCEIPQKVFTADGCIKYFKAALDVSQLVREVDTFARIAAASFASAIRISGLHGIVVSEDEQMILGLLIDWIPSIGTLQSEEARLAQKHHAKWEQQIIEIVRELHTHDIVWGDVHPGNIVIDMNLDAWVIDFGGGWVDEFVPRDKSGTKEGDLLGIKRVFDQLHEA